MVPHITLLYAALLTFLLVALILRIVRLRWALRVGLGDGEDKGLRKAIRAHGNFIETAPWAIFLMLLLEMTGAASSTILHVYGSALLTARLLHAWGISHHSGFSAGRGIGMVLTAIVMMTGAVLLLLRYFAG